MNYQITELIKADPFGECLLEFYMYTNFMINFVFALLFTYCHTCVVGIGGTVDVGDYIDAGIVELFPVTNRGSAADGEVGERDDGSSTGPTEAQQQP